MESPTITGHTLRILGTYAFYKNKGSSPRLHGMLLSDTGGETVSLAITCISRRRIVCDVIAAKIFPRRTQLYSMFHATNTLTAVIQRIDRDLRAESLNSIQDIGLLNKSLEGVTTFMKSLSKVERWRDEWNTLFYVAARITLRQNELEARQSPKISVL